MSQERELVTMIWRFQRGYNMDGPRLRTTIKSVVAILCAACFLTMSLGSVSRAIAAETWETWPRKTIVPGLVPNPETDANGWETWPRKTTVPGLVPNPETDANWSEKAGDASGKKTSKGILSGKHWWIAAVIAVVIGIGIAAGGGGGGESVNPGHQ